MTIAAALAQSPRPAYIENDRFSQRIGGTASATLSEYQPLQKDALACLTLDKLQTTVCQRVQDELASLLFGAISHAVLMNTFAAPSQSKFCDDYARRLIEEKKFAEAASYALLVIDERIQLGSSLYGKSMGETFLSKLIHDSLLESKPCRR